MGSGKNRAVMNAPTFGRDLPKIDGRSSGSCARRGPAKWQGRVNVELETHADGRLRLFHREALAGACFNAL
jgi:hypothetical protein